MLHGPITLVADGIDHLFVRLIIPVIAMCNFFGTLQLPQGRRLDGPIPRLLLMGTVLAHYLLAGPFRAIAR